MEIMLKEAARHHELYKHRSVDEFNIQEYNSEHKNWASSFQSFDSNSSSLSDGEFRLMELEYCGDRDGMEIFNETWSSSSSSSSSSFSLSKASNDPHHPSSASIHPSQVSHHRHRYSSPDPSPPPEISEPKPIFISSGRMTIEEAADEYLSSASDPLLTYTQTNLNDSYNQTENGEGLLNRSSTSFNHAFPINAWNWETIWKQPEASLDDDQIQQLLERGKSRIRMLLHHLVTPTNPPS
ncbi:hypothetical protein BKA69DRAFT_435972 [Paraphysoderma sedebokerense]|nr:hypothetical protein BKA69DRAFT_435972 [Paraphysoderma sedebokerense]